jgi:cell division protease FtsH
MLIRQETIEGEELEALFDSPRPKPDLVGPPGGRPATKLVPAAPVPPAAARSERDLPPSGTGQLRPQPAG